MCLGCVYCMYKLTYYVPETHVEEVKQAVFAAGAGKIGDYANCCWQVLGQGQFVPLEGSQSFIGTKGEVHKVAEYRVEQVCDDAFIEQAVAALKQAHPYETVAYDIFPLANFD